MVEIKEGDFVKIDYDIYANDKLVESTKKNGEAFPVTIIVGKNFILKALDDALLKNNEGELNLKPEEAFGKKDKKMIRTFPRTVFDEQKLKIVVGMVYDFNGMMGIVKSFNGGRVLIDFNHKFCDKNIRLPYKLVEKIEKLDEKISFVLDRFLKISPTISKILIKDKDITISVPAELMGYGEILLKALEEMLPETKDYKIKFDVFQAPKK